MMKKKRNEMKGKGKETGKGKRCKCTLPTTSRVCRRICLVTSSEFDIRDTSSESDAVQGGLETKIG